MPVPPKRVACVVESPRRLLRVGLVLEELLGRGAVHGEGLGLALVGADVARDEDHLITPVAGRGVVRIADVHRVQLSERARVHHDHLLAVRLRLVVGEERVLAGELRPAGELGVLADRDDLRGAEHDLRAVLVQVHGELGDRHRRDLAVHVDQDVAVLVRASEVHDVLAGVGHEVGALVRGVVHHLSERDRLVALGGQRDVVVVLQVHREGVADHALLVLGDVAHLGGGHLHLDEEGLVGVAVHEERRVEDLRGAVELRAVLVVEDHLQLATAVAVERDAGDVLRAVHAHEGLGVVVLLLEGFVDVHELEANHGALRALREETDLVVGYSRVPGWNTRTAGCNMPDP